MRSIVWDRVAAVAEVRDAVWRYISPASEPEAQELQAAALLRMSESELSLLRDVHFVTAPAVQALATALPSLTRSLPTTIVNEEEISAERIRGPIRWSRTYATRATTGDRTIFVTAPARRAFDTPENQLLVFVLREIEAAIGRIGWSWTGTGETRARLATHGQAIEQSSRVRALGDVPRNLPTPRRIAGIRAGRRAARFAAVLAVFDLQQRLYAKRDREELRRLVEQQALVVSSNTTLFELLVAMRIFDALARQGWRLSDPGTFEGGFQLRATRGDEVLVIYFKHVPRKLQALSRYGDVLREHSMFAGGLVPDLVLRYRKANGRYRWILVEVKGLLRRSVSEAARAALQDLFAYRRAFDSALSGQSGPYGLGVAWGRELKPALDSEVALCTPEMLTDALELLFPIH